MDKCMTVKISVDEPTITYEKDTQWERLDLERHAGNCPIPHFASGYCFNRAGEMVWGRPYRNYDYHKLSEEDAEKIRIYWTQATLEIGISPDDVQVEIWDEKDEWPILDTDEVEVRGIE